jgi:hypothetical protein
MTPPLAAAVIASEEEQTTWLHGASSLVPTDVLVRREIEIRGVAALVTTLSLR